MVIYKLRTENLEGQRDGWLSRTRSVAVSGQSREFFLDFTTDHFITLTNAWYFFFFLYLYVLLTDTGAHTHKGVIRLDLSEGVT